MDRQRTIDGCTQGYCLQSIFIDGFNREECKTCGFNKDEAERRKSFELVMCKDGLKRMKYEVKR